MSGVSARECERCGKPGWGRFCSYECWRLVKGLPSQEERTAASQEILQRRAEQQETGRPVCIACGDTGKKSKGGPCHACLLAGRIGPAPEEGPVEVKPAEVEGNAITSTDRPAERAARAVDQLSLFEKRGYV